MSLNPVDQTLELPDPPGTRTEVTGSADAIAAHGSFVNGVELFVDGGAAQNRTIWPVDER